MTFFIPRIIFLAVDASFLLIGPQNGFAKSGDVRMDPNSEYMVTLGTAGYCWLHAGDAKCEQAEQKKLLDAFCRDAVSVQ